MANNLHISYDLITPGKNYELLFERIKELGNWAKVQKSFWYVNSTYSASEARDYLKSCIDANDKLYVVDATNGQAAWYGIDPEVSNYIKDYWVK